MHNRAMSIVGSIAPHPHRPVEIERTLRAVTMGSTRSQRRWAGDGARMASADDAVIATAPGERVCVFDGRIDYKDDLRRAIGADAPEHGDSATLVLAAHARWGAGFADHVIGDWACAIWDGASRRLILAADAMGTRALHYHVAADGVLRFATEARALHADPEVPRALDHDRGAAWLALEGDGGEEAAAQTFFQGIRRVAPGTSVTYCDDKLRGKNSQLRRGISRVQH